MVRQGVEDTKLRLLEAAGEVFSKKGFKAATVRDICRLARANVAAVHYHFGGKDGLYVALLDEAFQAGLRRYPPDLNLPAGSTAEARLFAFVHAFLLRMLGEGRCAWCGKLMAREMHEPTKALDVIVERHIAPLAQTLREIVAQCFGPGTDADSGPVRLCAMSVVGQCQYLFRSKAILDRLVPDMRLDEPGIEDLARHITRFSLSAISGYAGPAARPRPRPTD